MGFNSLEGRIMIKNYWPDWPEIIGFLLLVIGFFISLGADSAVIAYTLVFLAGLMGGRIWFRFKSDYKTPWSIILAGFLVGFMLGARYGNKTIIMLFFLVGIAFSYHLHDKGIIKSIEY